MFIEVPPNSEYIDELMKYLLYELKIRDMTITKFRMLKLIFNIKMKLNKHNHELCSELPYYWYYFGPFSDVVADSFNFVKSKCDLKGKSIILKDAHINEFKNNELLSNFPEIEKITYNLLQDREKFYTTLEKDTYKKYAPLDIMYSFKYDIYDIANNKRSSTQFDIDDYVKTIFKCESKLPCDSYYNEYCDLFSKFVTNIDFINEENNFDKYWTFLRGPIKQLWGTFTKGVRVQFKDDFYNSQESQWDLNFKNSVNELAMPINETKNLVHLDELPKTDYTPAERKMVNATIGGYLRG